MTLDEIDAALAYIQPGIGSATEAYELASVRYPAALLALKAAMEQIEGMKQWGLALAIIAANEPIGSSAHTIAMEGISKAAAHAKAGKTQEVPNE